jgi:hypothetical protein
MCCTIRHHEYAFQVPMVMPPANKPNPAMGVRKLEMSATGRYMATVNDSQRTAVWLWDLHVLSLVCVLKHEQPVVSLAWDPVHDKLAICTASRRCAAFALSPPFFLICLFAYFHPVTASCTVGWNEHSGTAGMTCALFMYSPLDSCVTYTWSPLPQHSHLQHCSHARLCILSFSAAHLHQCKLPQWSATVSVPHTSPPRIAVKSQMLSSTAQ